MNNGFEHLGGLSYQLALELPAAELERRVGARLAELKAHAVVPGFRLGKAPLAEVRRRFGARVRREQAERLAQAEVRAALARQGLVPSAPPRLAVELEPTPRVTAGFEVWPAVPEVDLQSLKVSVPEVTIGEGDVEHMLRRIQEEQPRWAPHGDELQELRQQLRGKLRDTMELELAEAITEERVRSVEESLLAACPQLELPAEPLAAQVARLRQGMPGANEAELTNEARRLLASALLFAGVARQENLRLDPTALWRHTEELAAASEDPTAELDHIWGDGDYVQHLEEELLRRRVAEVVLEQAQVHNEPMSFTELAERRRQLAS